MYVYDLLGHKGGAGRVCWNAVGNLSIMALFLGRLPSREPLGWQIHSGPARISSQFTAVTGRQHMRSHRLRLFRTLQRLLCGIRRQRQKVREPFGSPDISTDISTYFSGGRTCPKVLPSYVWTRWTGRTSWPSWNSSWQPCRLQPTADQGEKQKISLPLIKNVKISCAAVASKL